MKYNAIIETDEFEDFEFYEDGNGKYIRGIDAGSVNGEWIALYFTEYKQESDVLDKIRAEVISLTDGCTPELIWNVDVLEIIDKYKAESEEKE